MKFKVGDKVRAISAYYSITSKDNNWEGIVTDVYGCGFDAKTTKCSKKNKIGEEFFSLNPERFELISNITLSDLQFADILTLRNGERYVVAQEYMYGEDGSYYANCDDLESCYNNDLTKNGDRDYDIMKIERAGQVIYEREEVKEMTIAEISEELGYEVKVVKEHE